MGLLKIFKNQHDLNTTDFTSILNKANTLKGDCLKVWYTI